MGQRLCQQHYREPVSYTHLTYLVSDTETPRLSFNLIFARSDGYLGGVNLDPDNYDEAFGLFKFATYIDAQLPYFYPNDQGGLSQTYQYDVWKANGQGYDVVGSPYFAIAMDSSILDYWDCLLYTSRCV